MARKAGYVLVALGVGLIAWMGVTMWWGDPITSLYTRHEQHVLSSRLEQLDRRWASRLSSSAAASAARASLAVRQTAIREGAVAFRRSLREGQPIGRIIVPRLHLNMVVVEGTSESALEKGPGHYDRASGVNTSLPGMGGVVAIAGHRTTYLAPFRHIDEIRDGDEIRLEMPYAAFNYTVEKHEVVDPGDVGIIKSIGYDRLVLTACHPPYSAAHRYAIFAKLTRTDLFDISGEGRWPAP
jgi:sortase A